MGYQQGLSGLAGASSALDVIGNNIANANTVGFKGATAQFADMYANSVATATNNQIGIGTTMSSVQQNFSQGTITTTDSALDVAINGNGFFQMSNNGALTYSRDGTFQRNASGYLVNAQGLNLMGYAANANGVINTATTVPLQAPTTNLAPSATSTISAQLNLNSQDTVPTGGVAAFSATNASTYNYSTSIQTYDSLGGAQQVNMYFLKTGPAAGATGPGTWEVFAGAAGQTPTDAGPITFDSSGNITSPSPATLSFTMPNTANTPTTPTVTLDLTGTTQYGGQDGVNNLSQNGYASGTLTNYTIGTDGKITGNYSNGQTSVLGQIVLANFNNPNGLVNLGGNQYAETADSGVPQISAPGSTNHGTLQGSALENSNVDLTSQLVDLITAQRNYQANAQTIKTQQAVDQTIVNL
ncbi:flagellar hook protein FlgE [Burkholderia guangdongensis]|uniref:flagellar hook protein FlgE n=1 Tax=Burkholderia guangdongensis TaxID=1792500 RepID=UPI0015C962D1|nr:flagellar hook protein FlgE [Burkholderia guangdongensis]